MWLSKTFLLSRCLRPITIIIKVSAYESSNKFIFSYAFTISSLQRFLAGVKSNYILKYKGSQTIKTYNYKVPWCTRKNKRRHFFPPRHLTLCHPNHCSPKVNNKNVFIRNNKEESSYREGAFISPTTRKWRRTKMERDALWGRFCQPRAGSWIEIYGWYVAGLSLTIPNIFEKRQHRFCLAIDRCKTNIIRGVIYDTSFLMEADVNGTIRKGATGWARRGPLCFNICNHS